MRGAEIVLPHGTTFVYVDEAPALLASAIYPERPPGRRLVVLQKLSAHEGARPDSLTPCDELKFAEVCAGLPPLFVGATEAEWRPYLAAFSAADNRPDWTPSPVWNDLNGFASMLRASTENLQKDALRDAVAGGCLALNYARVPTTEWDDAIMPLETFTAYAARLGVTVRVDVNPAGGIANKSEQAEAMIAHTSHNSLAVNEPPEQPSAQPASKRTAVETATEREDRRLREFVAMGGDYINGPDGWHATGGRGLLAAFIRKVEATGEPMRDGRNVREGLKKAATRAKNARAAGYPGSFVFPRKVP